MSGEKKLVLCHRHQGDGVLLQQLVPVLSPDQDLQVSADVGGRVLEEDRSGDAVSHRQVGDGVA